MTDLRLIPGEGKAPPPPPPPPPPPEPVMGCTTGGWVWYCDEHDTHGNADSEDEAAYMGLHHSLYHCESVPENDELCDVDVIRVGTGGGPPTKEVHDE